MIIVCDEHVEYTSITNFKTQSTYGVQPFTIAAATKPYLQMYIDIVQHKHGRNWECSDKLFLNYNGDAITDLNRYYNKFMETKLNIRFTTTSARALTETASYEALNQGIISPHEHASFLQVNGHSSGISKQHYVKQSMRKSAETAAMAFNKIHGTSADIQQDNMNSQAHNLPPAHSAPVKLNTSTYIPTLVPFGTLHSEQDPKALRAKWDTAELEALDQITSGRSPTNIIKYALNIIRNNKQLRKIFHARHVLKADRLRTGYLQLMRLKDKNSNAAADNTNNNNNDEEEEAYDEGNEDDEYIADDDSDSEGSW